MTDGFKVAAQRRVDVQSALDQREVGERLREVAEHAAVRGELLGVEAQIARSLSQHGEAARRLRGAPGEHQGGDEPKEQIANAPS